MEQIEAKYIQQQYKKNIYRDIGLTMRNESCTLIVTIIMQKNIFVSLMFNEISLNA